MVTKMAIVIRILLRDNRQGGFFKNKTKYYPLIIPR